MGLSRKEGVKVQEGQQFDICATVDEFRLDVNMYMYWKPGMEVYVSHIRRKSIPPFVLPEGYKRPCPSRAHHPDRPGALDGTVDQVKRSSASPCSQREGSSSPAGENMKRKMNGDDDRRPAKQQKRVMLESDLGKRDLSGDGPMLPSCSRLNVDLVLSEAKEDTLASDFEVLFLLISTKSLFFRAGISIGHRPSAIILTIYYSYNCF
jgi:poly(A) polymerase